MSTECSANDDRLHVLVLGLDGATFDLMLPWIEQGRLPTLAKLLARGAHSSLESTTPPITPCAWSSFMTGKNPGKHGLFDFVEPEPRGHGFRFTNASSRKSETLWGLLSRRGRPVGVVNVPMTYPPEPVNGYMISGLDTPHERSPYMHPEDVRKDLRREKINYQIDYQHLGNMNTDRRRVRQLRAIKRAETARTDALLHLHRTRPADFRMIVYGATDQVQHHFWHYMDPRHDKHDPRGAAKFKHAIRDVYEHVDGELGRILDGWDPQRTVVVVMSDHGFGPTSGVRVRFNQALEQCGLLKFAPEKSAGYFRRAVGRIADRALRSTLSPSMKRTIAGMFPRLRVWFENLDEARLQWGETQAYVNEAYRSSPAFWLNVESETPDGDGDSDSDRNSDSDSDSDRDSDRDGKCESESDREGRQVAEAMLLNQIEEEISRLTDPKTGAQVVSQLIRTRDIYHGPYVNQAPALLPSWWQDGFLLEQSQPGADPATTVDRPEAPIQGGVEFAGSHRLNGVFMAAGGPVRNSLAFEGARIIDVAPTLLHLMGEAIPDDMDGRVLTECLDPEWLARHPVRQVEADAPEQSPHTAFSDDESSLVAKRLQALGYIK